MLLIVFLFCVPGQEQQLKFRLLDCRSSYEFSAPELFPLRWQITAEILEEELGNPPFSETWKNELFDIWMNKK